MSQLVGADARSLYRLGDVGIDIVELCLGDVDVIHAPKDVDAVGHRLPVEGHVVGHVQVQVLVEGCNGLLRSALGISLVDLVILVLFADIQVGIPENGYQLDISRILVDAGQHNDIGVQTLADGTVPSVHTEYIEIPVAFHFLFLFHGKVLVLDGCPVHLRVGHTAEGPDHESIAENQAQSKELQHGPEDDLPDSGFLLLLPLPLKALLVYGASGGIQLPGGLPSGASVPVPLIGHGLAEDLVLHTGIPGNAGILLDGSFLVQIHIVKQVQILLGKISLRKILILIVLVQEILVQIILIPVVLVQEVFLRRPSAVLPPGPWVRAPAPAVTGGLSSVFRVSVFNAHMFFLFRTDQYAFLKPL